MRRTIISTMCMAVVLVLAAACNKVKGNSTSIDGNGRTVIKCVAENIGGGTPVKWNDNDRIWVKNGSGDDTFTLTAGKDTPTGVFTEEHDLGISGDIEAFYPASLKTDDGYVWPATQTNNQAAPMYAKQSIKGTENEVVSFSSLGAMLQIAFSTAQSDITLTSISLQDASKPLSGLFTVSDGQAIMTENSANPGVTLDLGSSGVPVGVATTYFYIAIPAGEYNGDKLTITFTDDVHKKECVITTTFPNVMRNTVGRITLAGNFENQKCTVKFDLNNTGLTGNFPAGGPSDLRAEANTGITDTGILLAENYGFRGWYKEAECINAWDFANDVVNGDMTLYAKWVADPLENGEARINGHDYVKLAGYYWATENAIAADYRIGHSEKYGDYFLSTSYNHYTPELVVNAYYGTPWTLPSVAHLNALIHYCYWEWTTVYKNEAISGFIVFEAKSENDMGKINECSGYSTDTVSHIFLPAGGQYISGGPVGEERGGSYWLSPAYTVLTIIKNPRKYITIETSLEDKYVEGYCVRAVAE